MEKKINSLCLEVLNRLNEAGILRDLIVIGSWIFIFTNITLNQKVILPILEPRILIF